MYEILDAESGNTKRVHFYLLKAAKRENVCGAPVGATDEESSEEEVPVIDQVPILPAVDNAALPAGTQNAVTAENNCAISASYRSLGVSISSFRQFSGA